MRSPLFPDVSHRRLPLRCASSALHCIALACAAVALLAAVGCGGASLDARLAEVRALQDAGRYQESVEPLREILAEFPDHPDANQLLGIALIQTNQHSLAIWPLEKAAKDPDHAITANMLLARTASYLRGWEDAIRALNRVLELQPDRLDALRARAQAYLNAGRLEDALEDANRLLEAAPDDYETLLLHATILSDLGRTEEATKEHLELRAAADKAGSPMLSAKACLAVATFFKDRIKDEEETERRFRSCADEFPTNRMVLQFATPYLDQIGESEDATALWKRAMEASPEDMSFRLDYAQRLLDHAGDVEKAEEVLRETAETFGTIQAWAALANFYRSQERFDDAADAVQKAVDVAGGGNDDLRFVQADIMLDAGRIDAARDVATTLSRDIYIDLLTGRIRLLEGDAKGALESLDSALRNWPNNAGARYLAGMAARELGDYDTAVAHLREAVRIDATATDAALAMASINNQRGEHERALAFARSYIDKRNPLSNAGYAELVEAAVPIGRFDTAREYLAKLAERGGDAAFIAAQHAALARAEKGPEAAVRKVRKAHLDLSKEENEVALRALVDNLAASGQVDEAMGEVDDAIEKRGEAASLYELRGTLLAVANRDADARASFEKALELDADNARAKAGLATLAARTGDLERAVALFEEAAALEPADPSYAYSAAQLTLSQGHVEDTLTRLRAILKEHPGHAGASNDLAWLLAERGEDLDEALQLARDAANAKPSAGVLDTLGWVHLKRNEIPAAVAAFERALELQADDPSVLYHLGLALKAGGENQRAIESLELALRGGDFAELAAARRELSALKQQ